jgi:putative ABC transport system permease protein
VIGRLLDSLRVLLGRRRFERDLDAELESHLQHQIDDLIGRGIPEPEARRRARAAFGAIDGAKDAARAARGIRWADELRGDLRYALRTLWKSPGYSAVAVATLALGIGANTAIFSVVDGVLLRALPFPESHRLVQLTRDYPLGALWTYRGMAASYTGVAAYAYGAELNLFAGGTAERIQGRAVSTEFFAVLGITPLLGRTFGPGEDAPGAAPVAVISEALWRRRFGAEPELVGRSIQIDGTPRQVVGIVPASFAFPRFGTEVWVPVLLDPSLHASVWGAGGTVFIARLKPGVTLAQADAEHRALITRVRDAYPWRMPDSFGQLPANHVKPLDEVIGAGVKDRLLLLLAAVGVLLLIACVNVANLNLTRLAGREREVAVRQVLGGSRLRVARQLVVEQLVVALAGGLCGVALAYAGIPLLLRLLPPDTPRLHEVAIDPRVLGFTALVILLAGLLAALGPIARLPETGKAELLGASARGSSAGPRRTRLSGVLVGTEVALSVVLCIGAVILLRSLRTLLSVDPGVSVARVTTARVTPDPVWCRDQAGPCTCDKATADARCEAFFPALEERLAALPGVRGVALATTVPLDGGWSGFAMDIEDHPVPRGQPAHILGMHAISPGYFAVLGIPLLAGRDFTAQDRGPDNPVVVVARTLADRRWPGGPARAIGKHLKPVWMPKWATVVGVVADVRYEGLSVAPGEEFYLPMAQWGIGSAVAVFKSELAPSALEPLLRREVSAVNPTATVTQVRSMEEVLAASAAQPRTTTMLIGSFAAIALLLGAIGVYGVLSYGVTQRRREIGIRMAVGAEPGAVRRMVLGRAARLLAGGVIAGLGAAWLAGSLLRGFVYGVSVRDPLSFVAVPLLFAAVGIAASYLPARRATRVSPTEVMREE